MITPKRIQRKRTKGWRMPPDTVSVCRPGKWGNPFKIGDPHPVHGRPISQKEAVDLFRINLFRYSHNKGTLEDLMVDEITLSEIKDELAGKNLACWCRLDEPCHGDVLLEIANDPSFDTHGL